VTPGTSVRDLGLGAAPRILQVSPESKILMFSQYDSSNIIAAALKAGALGYVVKSDAARNLLAGLRATNQGEQFISSRVAAPASGP
jgi:DNA-binding NarL/FixJ family response regulator